MIVNYTKNNLEMVRGDTLSFGIEIIDDAGHLVEADTIYFSCKKTPEDTEYLFQKSLGDGITSSSNKYVVRVAPEDTENADLGLYNYDLEIGKNGDIFTILVGTLKIISDITRGE